jgi:glycosyltransferase involved in cell wall biosynthesis
MVSPAAVDLIATRAPAVRPRRVLLVAPQPFFALRGTPINVRQMVKTLCAAGYDVHLATYGLGEPVEIDGLTLHRAPVLPGVRHVPIGFSITKVVMDALLAVRVWTLLARHHFDVVHTVEESVFFTLPAARLRHTPVIYDMDSSIAQQLEYSGVLRSGLLLRGVRAMERVALRRAALVVTVCRALTDDVHGVDARIPVVQIEDCPLEEALRDPEPDIVAGLRERFGLSGARVAVYTGNLEPYQGVDLLLDAFPSVIARCPSARLVIVGGEPAQIAATRAVAAARGIGDAVVFTGRQPPSLMAEFMALAHVLVSPRRSGTNTPLKLFSYMYAGVPIVATALSTHTQILDAGTALLCAPTRDALADAMARVLEDPPAFRRIGAAARDRVLRDHSPESFSRKLLDSYAAVLGDTLATRTTSM